MTPSCSRPPPRQQPHRPPWYVFNCTVSKQHIDIGSQHNSNKGSGLSASSGNREQKAVLQISLAAPSLLQWFTAVEALAKGLRVKGIQERTEGFP